MHYSLAALLIYFPIEKKQLEFWQLYEETALFISIKIPVFEFRYQKEVAQEHRIIRWERNS